MRRLIANGVYIYHMFYKIILIVLGDRHQHSLCRQFQRRRSVSITFFEFNELIPNESCKGVVCWECLCLYKSCTILDPKFEWGNKSNATTDYHWECYWLRPDEQCSLDVRHRNNKILCRKLFCTRLVALHSRTSIFRSSALFWTFCTRGFAQPVLPQQNIEAKY